MNYDAANKISAVIPVRLGENRKTDSGVLVDILFRSLERFCEPGMFEKILVVCPSAQTDLLRERMRKWEQLPIEVLDQNFLLAGLSIRMFTPGWAIQQLVKMVACRFVETDFYITLDADCFCTRATKFSDLVRDGKGIIQMESKDVHRSWWKESGRVLGYEQDFEKPGMSVTPAVLSTTAMSELLAELGRRHGRWDVYLQNYYQFPHIFKAGLFASVWTEYGLYFSFLEMNDRVWDFHEVREGRRLISAHSCWKKDDFQKWDPASVFSSDDAGIFALIQSNLRLDISDIRRRLEPYF